MAIMPYTSVSHVHISVADTNGRDENLAVWTLQGSKNKNKKQNIQELNAKSQIFTRTEKFPIKIIN